MARPSSEESPRLARRNDLIRTLRREFRAPIGALAKLFGVTERTVYRVLTDEEDPDQAESHEVPAGLCSVA